jgi:hypothetical protein
VGWVRLDESRGMRDQFGTKRLRLSDEHRRRLAAKGARSRARCLRLMGADQCAFIAARIDMPDAVKRSLYAKLRV